MAGGVVRVRRERGMTLREAMEHLAAQSYTHVLMDREVRSLADWLDEEEALWTWLLSEGRLDIYDNPPVTIQRIRPDTVAVYRRRARRPDALVWKEARR